MRVDELECGDESVPEIVVRALVMGTDSGLGVELLVDALLPFALPLCVALGPNK